MFNRRTFFKTLVALVLTPKITPKRLIGVDWGYQPSQSQIMFYGGAAGGGKTLMHNEYWKMIFKQFKDNPKESWSD